MQLRVVLVAALVLAASETVRAADTPTASYTKDVKPFLTRYCMECHSGAKPKQGYSVESFEALLKSGRKGALVVAEKPDESLLIRTLAGKGKVMPPKKFALQPKAAEIAKVRAWIKEGAKNDSATALGRKDLDARSE
jgi:hypothetical protein